MHQTAVAEKQVESDQVTSVDTISRKDFYTDFVRKKRPLVIRKLTEKWKALEWDSDYLRSRDSGIRLSVKSGDVSEGIREMVGLRDYIGLLEQYEAQFSQGTASQPPPYLHDVPFFHLFPDLRSDIKPFPLHLFPEWYWPNWHNYIQFFMGPTGGLTPLHFDTLCTNNLFFQIVGKKKFILIPAEQKQYCYVERWRWAKFDPNAPDFERYPLAKATTPFEVVLGPGEILYIPSGMLHQVHSLSYSISFNIDWHTTQTARQGMMTIFRGAPLKNGYYNLLSYLGVGLKIPSRVIFPYYKSYLNYVS